MGDRIPHGTTKSELRRDMRRMRLALTDRPERSRSIWHHVIAQLAVQAAERIMVFSSIPGEPEIEPFVAWATARGVETAVPEDGVEPSWPQVVIVPGVAFTAAGQRLGQGGGWYDRFLVGTSPPCVTIGVGFSEQLVDQIPTEPHDVVLDHVITDSGLADHANGVS
ncbi:MAG: 5-formyltetrahydrofolate cyclo-ligase [Ilumatobacteraceae bacterium]